MEEANLTFTPLGSRSLVLARAQFSGKTSAFQADDAGSIAAARFILFLIA